MGSGGEGGEREGEERGEAGAGRVQLDGRMSGEKPLQLSRLAVQAGGVVSREEFGGSGHGEEDGMSETEECLLWGCSLDSELTCTFKMENSPQNSGPGTSSITNAAYPGSVGLAEESSKRTSQVVLGCAELHDHSYFAVPGSRQAGHGPSVASDAAFETASCGGLEDSEVAAEGAAALEQAAECREDVTGKSTLRKEATDIARSTEVEETATESRDARGSKAGFALPAFTTKGGENDSAAPCTAAELKVPRLKWTKQLRESFKAAVAELGGIGKATPKRILDVMATPGLSLWQVKSFLQKYRKYQQRNDSLPSDVESNLDEPAGGSPAGGSGGKRPAREAVGDGGGDGKRGRSDEEMPLTWEETLKMQMDVMKDVQLLLQEQCIMQAQIEKQHANLILMLTGAKTKVDDSMAPNVTDGQYGMISPRSADLEAAGSRRGPSQKRAMEVFQAPPAALNADYSGYGSTPPFHSSPETPSSGAWGAQALSCHVPSVSSSTPACENAAQQRPILCVPPLVVPPPPLPQAATARDLSPSQSISESPRTSEWHLPHQYQQQALAPSPQVAPQFQPHSRLIPSDQHSQQGSLSRLLSPADMVSERQHMDMLPQRQTQLPAPHYASADRLYAPPRQADNPQCMGVSLFGSNGIPYPAQQYGAVPAIARPFVAQEGGYHQTCTLMASCPPPPAGQWVNWSMPPGDSPAPLLQQAYQHGPFVTRCSPLQTFQHLPSSGQEMPSVVKAEESGGSLPAACSSGGLQMGQNFDGLLFHTGSGSSAQLQQIQQQQQQQQQQSQVCADMELDDMMGVSHDEAVRAKEKELQECLTDGKGCEGPCVGRGPTAATRGSLLQPPPPMLPLQQLLPGGLPPLPLPQGDVARPNDIFTFLSSKQSLAVQVGSTGEGGLGDLSKCSSRDYPTESAPQQQLLVQPMYIEPPLSLNGALTGAVLQQPPPPLNAGLQQAHLGAPLQGLSSQPGYLGPALNPKSAESDLLAMPGGPPVSMQESVLKNQAMLMFRKLTEQAYLQLLQRQLQLQNVDTRNIVQMRELCNLIQVMGTPPHAVNVNSYHPPSPQVDTQLTAQIFSGAAGIQAMAAPLAGQLSMEPAFEVGPQKGGGGLPASVMSSSSSSGSAAEAQEADSGAVSAKGRSPSGSSCAPPPPAPPPPAAAACGGNSRPSAEGGAGLSTVPKVLEGIASAIQALTQTCDEILIPQCIASARWGGKSST